MHFKKSGSFRFYLENNKEIVLSTRSNTVCEHLELKGYFNNLIHRVVVDKPIRLFLNPCKMPILPKLVIYFHIQLQSYAGNTSA